MRRYEPNHLFQMSCADMTERFQIMLSLAMIFIVAMNEPGAPRFSLSFPLSFPVSFPLAWAEWEESLCYKAGLIVVGEMAADAIKHAFINKFNGIHAAVYADFAAVIRMDILSNQKDQIILDHTYSVTRRLGLCQVGLPSPYSFRRDEYEYEYLPPPASDSPGLHVSAVSAPGLVGPGGHGQLPLGGADRLPGLLRGRLRGSRGGEDSAGPGAARVRICGAAHRDALFLSGPLCCFWVWWKWKW